MDADQQSHGYVRPPPAPPQQPPPMTDQCHQQNPYFHHHQQQQQPAPPPLPQQRPPVLPHGHQWYSNQLQYQPPPSSHSPYPHPPSSQWGAPHASSAYPPPPYPAQHYPLPPRPYPPLPPQVSQSYPHPNQDWANSNWNPHPQGFDYTAQNNVQDWAARAKEWANARVAMENQHMQFQYPQTPDCHYADTQKQPIPASSYQQFPVPYEQPYQSQIAYLQENAATSSMPSSIGHDGHIPFLGRDGAPAGEANVGFPPHESSHSSPCVNQQEVPSSYSSVTGTEETANQKEQTYSSLPMPISSAQDGNHFAYGNQAVHPHTDPSDLPLEFTPRFNNDQDLHMQPSYAAHHEPPGTLRGINVVAAVPSVNSWNPPVAPGAYTPIPPVLPAEPQHDPSIPMASVPGPAAPQFGRFPGPGFQPTIPCANAFGIGAGATLHPATTSSGDVYGVSGVSERLKKAPVPNWLKEEIIKNKATITKSSLENPKGEKLSIDEEFVYKSSRKGDQADSKSIDSSRSTKGEDDDVDNVEAAKTAEINLEIKRILTEVLLKVTDELLDEIAMKVLNEGEMAIEINDKNVTSNYKDSPPPLAIPTPKGSAKVLIPSKAKESETEVASGKTSSSSPGDVLGLANYASNDDGDDEIQSSSVPNSRNNIVQQSNMNKHSDDIHGFPDNGLNFKPEKRNKAQTHSRNGLRKTDDVGASTLSDEENGVDGSGLNETLGEKAGMKTKRELHGAHDCVKISTNDNLLGTETRMKPVKNDQHEFHDSRKSSSGKDSGKEVETGRGVDDKGDQNRRRQDERQSTKEKIDYRNGSRDKTRDEGGKSDEKAKESKSRKRSTDDVRNDRKNAERNQRGSSKEGIDRKRERSIEEDTRRKITSNSGRHNKRRSSPISSKGNSKENSVSHNNESIDQLSDDYKRKRHSRKRHPSPSPVRSNRRQVMRSPHSKHSQRRHSPYSPLETTRGRSRSRSPGRRHR